MGKIKYPPELRLKIVLEYLEGPLGYKALRQKKKIKPFITKKARKITVMQYISLRKHSDMSELRSRYAKTSSEQSDIFSFPHFL